MLSFRKDCASIAPCQLNPAVTTWRRSSEIGFHVERGGLSGNRIGRLSLSDVQPFG
jgi:hypothetical protein